MAVMLKFDSMGFERILTTLNALKTTLAVGIIRGGNTTTISYRVFAQRVAHLLVSMSD